MKPSCSSTSCCRTSPSCTAGTRRIHFSEAAEPEGELGGLHALSACNAHGASKNLRDASRVHGLCGMAAEVSHCQWASKHLKSKAADQAIWGRHVFDSHICIEVNVLQGNRSRELLAALAMAPCMSVSCRATIRLETDCPPVRCSSRWQELTYLEAHHGCHDNL